MTMRIVHTEPLPLPKIIAPDHRLPFNQPGLSFIPGQAAAIRFFDPDSKSDYQAMRQIVQGKAARVWMDDPHLTREEYRDWAGTQTNASFLFAIHNAQAYKRKAAEAVCGFVYFYSERAEKYRVKRLKKMGYFKPELNPQNALEVSFAVRPFVKGRQFGSGLMSSALRQSCLQVKRFFNVPNKDLKLFAFVDLENLAAQRTLVSSGFQLCGQLKYDLDSPSESAFYVLSWRHLTQKIKSKLPSLLNQTSHLQCFPQQTDSHCGPAVIQTLLSRYQYHFTQDEIVTAAQARSRLQAHGFRPIHLAKAVSQLAPRLQFWFKEPANIHDLVALIHTFHVPVGINWQGLFYDTLAEEKRFNPKGEHGHISLLVDIDPDKDQVTIADPYPEYNQKPRTFSYTWFKTRWWDVDHVYHRKTKKRDELFTRRFLFIVVPQETSFPASLHLKKWVVDRT